MTYKNIFEHLWWLPLFLEDNLSTYSLKEDGFVPVWRRILCRNLLAQSQQWKHHNNLWYLFKVNYKCTNKTLLVSFWCVYC